MNTQHTPGPWTYIPSQVSGPVWTILNYGTPIADIPQDTNDSEANARLIAAAPELLAALKAVDSILSQPWKDCNGPHTLAIAKADCALAQKVIADAIAKATR